ncbi:IPT/TIG domain-containing protein [Spirosoma utsteinense]|uniref:IPT/TIG domain-containing protein n=1 Tax=Spirosoma utsteinense TaxID=2585773 RepID=A0ABR6W7U7_9BACT|nr:IPT/TIG domain-containing protein [Spirosoma utsteinense]MBC3787743.1 hypothetical protein [Spirosoma utsteinense]MBC3792653.1 hypothetical protein [Spirosoma utsteinense]
MKSRLSLFVCFLQLLVGWSCRVQTNPPELITIAPTKAFVGTEISLTGYQFGADPIVTVGIGATAVSATLIAKDENSIRAVVPLVPPGLTQVRVSNDQGVSDPLPFEVQQPPPTLTGITPGNGLPGTAIVLTGNYLNQIRQIRFNDVRAVVQDSSAQAVTVVVPDNLPRGPLTIVVETAGGILSGDFILAGTPQITSVSPKITRPGAELIIQGTNLTDAIIRINDQQMDRTRTTIKDTEIRTIVPEFATTGRITVTVFEKLIASSTDTVQVIQPPFITALGARDGVAGDKLLLTGGNLRDVSAVSFGTVAAQFRIVSNTEIEVIVPPLAVTGSVTIAVSSVGGNSRAADPFFYYQKPGAITFTPARQVRSRAITISGQNLYRITDVRINGQSVSITDRVEGSQLLVNIPPDGTSGLITVVNRAGSVTSAIPLVVVQKPLITGTVPTKAKLGDRVIIQGDFLLDAQIFFSGTNTPAIDAGRNDDKERWVLVPNGAQTGPLRIVNAAGETTTSVFTVIPPVSIIDFAPKTAKVGATLVISGQNLTAVQQVKFSNGTSSAATFVVDANGQLVVTVPVGAVTGQICLTSEGGVTCTSTNFTLEK